MDTPALQISNLRKRYRGSTAFALDGISLEAMPGQVYGFLGSNGAGKSTTIRCALNFIQPTEGSITICGLDSVHDSVAAKRCVGYLAGEAALYGKLTGQQLLDYLAELQPPRDPQYRDHLVTALEAELHKPIATLSKGNRQKIALIQALMHQPEVLILDEPTSGLDPLMQEVFFQLIADAKARGASAFISSHNFSEVQRMCDRVGFLRAGKLVADKSLADLAHTTAHTFTITFRNDMPLHELRRAAYVTITHHEGRTVTLAVKEDLSPLFGVLAKHAVVQFRQQDTDLEDEFLQLYEKETV